MRPTLVAVAKKNLADRDEVVADFNNKAWFTNNTVFNLKPDSPTIQARPVNLQHNATFDVVHSRDCIYETSSKVKEVIGLVDNLAVFENESYEVLIHDLVEKAGAYKVEKSVRLNLKDYKGEDKHVDLVKITSKDGLSVLIVSDTLAYQSHVPF